MDAARADMSGMDGDRAEASLGLRDDDFRAKLAEDKAALSSLRGDASLGASGGAGGGGFSIPGGMFTMLGAGISSLLPAVGGATAGLGLLGGTGALAFGGIARALQAHSQASQATGQTQAQLAATAFSNSVAIQQAQQAEAQAYQQAAEAAIQSAAQIESAKMSEAEVVRNAAASQAQAEQAVTQAQQQQQAASFGLGQAQYNLRDAWIQARYALQQLNDAERNSATTIKAARLAVEQAQYQQTLTDQNAMSTSLDRQQAAIAVTQAQEQLTAAQQQAAYTGQEANLQDQAGVAGSQQVLQAKQAVKQAMEAVRNAAVAEKDAVRNLTDTELNNADAIKAAQLAVSQAVQQAAFQQQQAAQAEQNAAQNVANTWKEQQLQAAATASTSNQAANQFIRDMARLSPAARGFVRELLGMHGALRTLESIAQGTVLPGVTIFLQGVKSILPEIDAGVRMMGTAMGQAFGQFGKLMQTSAFKDGLAGLIRNGMQFANTVLPAFAQFFQMIGRIGAKSGAVTGLANLLAGLAHGLTGLVSSLGPAIRPLSEFWSVIGSALSSLGPLIGKVIGGLADTLGPVVKALLPGFQLLASTLGSSLQTALSGLAPVLVPVAKAISDIVIALAPLLPSLAKMIAQFAQGLGPMLTSLLPVVKELAGIFAQQMQAGLQQMLGSLIPLVPAVGRLVTSLVPLIDGVLKAAGFVLRFSADIGGPVTDALVRAVAVVIDVASKWTEAFGWVKDAALFLWHGVLDPMWHGIEAGLSWLDTQIGSAMRQIESLFTGLGDAARFLWHNVFDPVWQGIEAGARGFVSGFETVWNRLTSVFRTPVNFLINTVYDHGIRRLWDDVVNAIGLTKLQLPYVQPLAGGGIVPGRDYGYDTHLAALRGGEGVLQPGAVGAIGGPPAVHALNSKFGDKPVTSATHGGVKSAGWLPGFAHGGVVGNHGGFWHWLSRLGSDFLHGAEMLTNPVAAITGLLGKAIRPGTATGNMAKIIEGIPHALIGDLAKVFGSDETKSAGGMGTGSQGGLGGSAQGRAVVNFAESYIGRVPYVYGGTSLTSGVDCSGFTMDVLERFGFHPPRTSEEQYQWVQRVPKPVLGGLAFYTGSPIDPPPGHVGIVTGSNQMVDAYGTGFGVRLNSIYGSSGTVMGFGVPPGGGLQGKTLDSGGYLMPMGMPGGGPGFNFTGQPEAVLDPRQTQLLETLVQRLGSGASGVAGQPVVQFVYNGTQHPTPEQQAQMKRDLALALSNG